LKAVVLFCLLNHPNTSYFHVLVFLLKYFTNSAIQGLLWNMTRRICLFFMASILSPSNAFAGGNALTEYVVSWCAHSVRQTVKKRRWRLHLTNLLYW
jgi:hypothetical protein